MISKPKRAGNRPPPPLDPWGPGELAVFLRKMCGTLFRVGELEEKEGAHLFWVLLPEENAVVRMARVTVTKKLEVTVAVRGVTKKIETLLQEDLRRVASASRTLQGIEDD